MNILLKYNNEYLQSNLEDFVPESVNKVFSVNNTEDAVKIINEKGIEKVLLEIDELEEVNFLSYVNKYFPDIEVVIITNSINENIFSAIKNGMFALMKRPLDLNRLLAEC
jgi:DNA-binding NtrC family response regulator